MTRKEFKAEEARLADLTDRAHRSGRAIVSTTPVVQICENGMSYVWTPGVDWPQISNLWA